MYPVGLCLQILPDVLMYCCGRFLVGPQSVVLENVRAFYEFSQARWVPQRNDRRFFISALVLLLSCEIQQKDYRGCLGEKFKAII